MQVNALGDDGRLTALGQHMALLPMDVRMAKFILFGAILRCLDPVLTIAASMSYRSPFVAPFEMRSEASKSHALCPVL